MTIHFKSIIILTIIKFILDTWSIVVSKTNKFLKTRVEMNKSKLRAHAYSIGLSHQSSMMFRILLVLARILLDVDAHLLLMIAKPFVRMLHVMDGLNILRRDLCTEIRVGRLMIMIIR